MPIAGSPSPSSTPTTESSSSTKEKVSKRMVPFWTSYHCRQPKVREKYCSQESQGSCGPPVKKQLEVRCLSMLADIVSLFLSNPCPGVDDSMLRSPCRVLGPQSALRGAIDGQQIPDRHGPVLKNYSSRVQYVERGHFLGAAHQQLRAQVNTRSHSLPTLALTTGLTLRIARIFQTY